jgi:hypothetical protein
MLSEETSLLSNLTASGWTCGQFDLFQVEPLSPFFRFQRAPFGIIALHSDFIEKKRLIGPPECGLDGRDDEFKFLPIRAPFSFIFLSRLEFLVGLLLAFRLFRMALAAWLRLFDKLGVGEAGREEEIFGTL